MLLKNQRRVELLLSALLISISSFALATNVKPDFAKQQVSSHEFDSQCEIVRSATGNPSQTQSKENC